MPWRGVQTCGGFQVRRVLSLCRTSSPSAGVGHLPEHAGPESSAAYKNLATLYQVRQGRKHRSLKMRDHPVALSAAIDLW